MEHHVLFRHVGAGGANDHTKVFDLMLPFVPDTVEINNVITNIGAAVIVECRSNITQSGLFFISISPGNAINKVRHDLNPQTKSNKQITLNFFDNAGAQLLVNGPILIHAIFRKN